MSTPRIHMSAATTDLVISKAGYDASDPNLADANKIFDSDWLFGGGIILCGRFLVPCNGTNHVIPFPTQAEIPAAEVWTCSVPAGYFAAFTGDAGTDSYVEFGPPSTNLPTGPNLSVAVTTSGIVVTPPRVGACAATVNDAKNGNNLYQPLVVVVHGM
ncbi:MAG: hypothetical protein ACTHKQ_21895 [Mesorhizobium sp.]